MASLRDIRGRINSVKSTRQITNAMKMVSAAKLKKAQDKINSAKPYVNAMSGIINNLSLSLSKKEESCEYTEPRKQNNILIILISANRGLCGAFNANVCKKSINIIEEKFESQAKNGKVKFFCIGKKAVDFIKKTDYSITDSNVILFEDLSFQNVSKLSEKFMKFYKNYHFDRIELVYNSFKAPGVSNIIDEQFLPIEIKKEQPEFPTEYILEPDLTHLKEQLIPDFLKTKLFSVLLDTVAAEHGARMTAMHQATDNASELIKDLTLAYNKARQATITKEILEITSGAEALSSG